MQPLTLKLNRDGGFTLTVRDQSREFGMKFSTLQEVSDYCDKAGIRQPRIIEVRNNSYDPR